MEHFEWHELEDKAPDEFQGADAEAENVMFHGKRIGLDGVASELDEDHLDADCQKEDDNEPRVVEEVLEYVILVLSKLPRIDQVENLHENKDLENNRVVKHLLSVLVLLSFVGRDYCLWSKSFIFRFAVFRCLHVLPKIAVVLH